MQRSVVQPGFGTASEGDEDELRGVRALRDKPGQYSVMAPTRTFKGTR